MQQLVIGAESFKFIVVPAAGAEFEEDTLKHTFQNYRLVNSHYHPFRETAPIAIAFFQHYELEQRPSRKPAVTTFLLTARRQVLDKQLVHPGILPLPTGTRALRVEQYQASFAGKFGIASLFASNEFFHAIFQVGINRCERGANFLPGGSTSLPDKSM